MNPHINKELDTASQLGCRKTHRMFEIFIGFGYAVSHRFLRFYTKYSNIYTSFLGHPKIPYFHGDSPCKLPKSAI